MGKKNMLFINYLSWNRKKAVVGIILGLALFFFSSALVSAQNQSLIFGQPNTYGIGPRSMGMGGAFTAVADDASAAYWNPAGLSQLSSYEIELSSAPIYFDSDVTQDPNTGSNIGFGSPWFESIQFMIPIAKDNTLGISFFRPFHPQQDFFAGNSILSSGQRDEGSYLLNPTFQESEIVLSYAARFAGVNNFSVGINVKRITNDPYYILYLERDDNSITQELGSPIQVVGYGLDLGLLYKIPITKYSEEFRIGLSLMNLVSQVQYSNGLLITPTTSGEPTSFNVGPGFETTIPPQITLGLAYKNNYLFKIRNITDLDFDQISDARFDSSDNKIIRFGTEFWFLDDVLGVRAGYSTQLSTPGTISLGFSIRALNGDFETDLAYLQPVSPTASIAAGSAIGTYDDGGINFEDFHIGVSYRFGGGEEIPPPKVSAFVRPSSFTPSQGEKASFFLDTTEDVSVNHWSVLIYDQSNRLVRGLRGIGSPPSKLVWGGENDQYEPLPAGIYTWAFQVQDQLNHIGSTPVQTVEILGLQEQTAKDPTKLLAIRQQQSALLAQERQQLTALALQNLKKLLGTVEATPTSTTVGVVQTPVDANGNSITPEAGNVAVLGFNNLSPDQVLNAHFDKNSNGDSVIAVSYRSNLTYVPYLYQEAAEVIKTTVNSVGTGLKEISTRVYYGKNELTMVTPSPVAATYSTGKIDQTKLLQLSDIHINGVKVGPNGY